VPDSCDALSSFQSTPPSRGATARFFGPYKKIKEELRQLKSHLEKHDQLLEKDHKRFGVIEEDLIVMMQTDFALLEHARTDNATGMMAEASKNLQAHLVARK